MEKRKTKLITRDIFLDQYEAMLYIEAKTGTPSSRQIREALDKELKLGAYKTKK
jgi:hypothetical protein